MYGHGTGLLVIWIYNSFSPPQNGHWAAGLQNCRDHHLQICIHFMVCRIFQGHSITHWMMMIQNSDGFREVIPGHSEIPSPGHLAHVLECFFFLTSSHTLSDECLCGVIQCPSTQITSLKFYIISRLHQQSFIMSS